jgi:hypothetical protein
MTLLGCGSALFWDKDAASRAGMEKSRAMCKILNVAYKNKEI